MFEVTDTEYTQFVYERAPFTSRHALDSEDQMLAAERDTERRALLAAESPAFYAGWSEADWMDALDRFDASVLNGAL